jgi:phage protein D
MRSRPARRRHGARSRHSSPASGTRSRTARRRQALAGSRLHFKNRKRRSGSISLVGDVRALAGVTVEMTDFGKYSGTYLIDRSTHRMDRGGYTTDAELLDARK